MENKDLIKLLKSAQKDEEKELESIISSPECDLPFDLEYYKENIKDYGDFCKITNVKWIGLAEMPYTSWSMKTLAQERLNQIVHYFSKTWVLDWNNKSQRKYFPYFKTIDDGKNIEYAGHHTLTTHCEAGWVFETPEISTWIGTTFIDIYRDLILK